MEKKEQASNWASGSTEDKCIVAQQHQSPTINAMLNVM